MSARRAAIRRERKERAKAEKCKSPQGVMKRAMEQGRLDGRTVAVSIVLVTLKQKYCFGEGRMMKFINFINRESLNFDQEATMFNLEYYVKRLKDKINETGVDPETSDLTEIVYLNARDDYFISSASVMFMVLNEYFGFGSNLKGTGRIDFVMETMVNEYIKMVLDKDVHTVDYYYNRMKEVTKLNI